ncbi:hypothetical protein CWB99_05525 [Pseudoalteromonas rubra]|uniref:Uncharacterized protein n=1 Tax=Pseudoalteromonas rubra TaxID=43658 RepID=A0A5S3WS42_9GAMM|nr:hypothetical protein [Pseudoalteromonas rubra]TMP30794.1 hypothetical protein CWB99_05525 [Pseudoalteromonas rubra]TMP34162.1 hypothetical protein CWC00_08355 [Pseudoalteromonas rubra]
MTGNAQDSDQTNTQTPWQNLDLSTARDSSPMEAPVSDPEPLTGKEKAGVNLTWGIIAVLIGFLLIILSIFVWGEIRFFNAITANPNNTLTAEQMQAKLELLATQRATFRAFWFDTLQLIILNVLFPTLTALLGYVFGTSRNNGA